MQIYNEKRKNQLKCTTKAEIFTFEKKNNTPLRTHTTPKTTTMIIIHDGRAEEKCPRLTLICAANFLFVIQR